MLGAQGLSAAPVPWDGSEYKKEPRHSELRFRQKKVYLNLS